MKRSTPRIRHLPLLILGASLCLAPAPTLAQAPAQALAQESPAPNATYSELIGQWQTARSGAFRPAVLGVAERYPQSKSAALRSEEAGLAVNEARAGYFPTVNIGLEGVAASTNRTVVNGESEHIDDVDEHRVDAVAQVSQLLYDFGATPARVEAAKLREKYFQEQSASTRVNVIQRSVAAWFDVLRYRMLINISQLDVQKHQATLDRVRERAQAGAGGKSDLMRAEGRAADARSRLIAYQGELARASSVYQELYGEAPPADLGFPENSPAIRSVEEHLAYARDNSPALKGQRALAVASDEEASAVWKSTLPRLTLELSGTKYEVNKTDDDLRDYSAGLRASYNLFTGGADTARIRQARSRAEQARQDEIRTALEVDRLIRSYHADVAARRERLNAIRLELAANEGSLDAYQEQFNIGKRSLIDILDAQRDLFSTASLMVNSLVDLEISRHALLAVSGEIEPFFQGQ